MNTDNICKLNNSDALILPIIEDMVPAGFPTPTQGLPSDSIDLNRELIHHPACTFCARVSGDSMIESGISDGDLLIIDKSLSPKKGSIAVCFIDGEFTLKQIDIRIDGVYLVPANKDYPTLKVSNESNFQIWGIVTHTIKSFV